MTGGCPSWRAQTGTQERNRHGPTDLSQNLLSLFQDSLASLERGWARVTCLAYRGHLQL